MILSPNWGFRKSCVGFNIESIVGDMAILLKFNIFHGRISQTNKDI